MTPVIVASLLASSLALADGHGLRYGSYHCGATDLELAPGDTTGVVRLGGTEWFVQRDGSLVQRWGKTHKRVATATQDGLAITGDDPLTCRFAAAPAPDKVNETAAAVQQRLAKAYRGSIQACYKQVLATDPTAKGALKIAFTVEANGHTSHGKATGISAALEQCVTAKIASWTFDPPTDAKGQPTSLAFQVQVALSP